MGSCTQFWSPYIWLMAVSCPGFFLYVKLRRANDRLMYNVQKPALLRPSLHIGATPINIKIAKVLPMGICPWDNAVYIRLGININNYHAIKTVPNYWRHHPSHCIMLRPSGSRHWKLWWIIIRIDERIRILLVMQMSVCIWLVVHFR